MVITYPWKFWCEKNVFRRQSATDRKTEAQVTKAISIVKLGLEPSFPNSQVDLHAAHQTATQGKASILHIQRLCCISEAQRLSFKDVV